MDVNPPTLLSPKKIWWLSKDARPFNHFWDFYYIDFKIIWFSNNWEEEWVEGFRVLRLYEGDTVASVMMEQGFLMKKCCWVTQGGPKGGPKGGPVSLTIIALCLMCYPWLNVS